MNDNKKESLKSLGLSEKEAELYLAGVILGNFSITEVSAKANLKRSSAYVLAENLIEKGLFVLTPSRGKKMYHAQNLNTIIFALKAELKEAEFLAEKIESMRLVDTEHRPQVEMYIGIKEIQKIWNKVLEIREKHLRIIGSWEQAVTTMDPVFALYFKNRLKERKVITHAISLEHRFNELDPDEIEGLTPLDISMDDSVVIFDDYVAIITNERNPHAVLFRGERLARSMKAVYFSLYELSVIHKERSVNK